MNRYRCRMAIGLILILSITACGGGGSNSTTSPSNLSIPLQAAFVNMAQNGLNGNFTISGWQQTSNDGSGNCPCSNSPLSGNGTLGMAPAVNGLSATVISGTMNGSPFDSTGSSSFASTTAPATVTDGDTGTIGPDVYSVSPGGSNSLLLTLSNTAVTGFPSTTTATQTVLRITTAGTPTYVSITTSKSFGGTEYENVIYTF